MSEHADELECKGYAPHTKVPWRKGTLFGRGRFELLGKGDIYIGEIHMTSSACLSRVTSEKVAQANADFIVRAVNAHKDLLAACEIATKLLAHADCIQGCGGSGAIQVSEDEVVQCQWCAELDDFKAALAKTNA